MPRASKEMDAFIDSYLDSMYVDTRHTKTEAVSAVNLSHITALTLLVAFLSSEMKLTGYVRLSTTTLIKCVATARLRQLIQARFEFQPSSGYIWCKPRYDSASIEEFVNGYHLKWKLMVFEKVLRS